MPDKLTPDQWEEVWKVNAQHPTTWTRGFWYPAIMADKPVEIQRTRSRGMSYLKIRKQVTVNLKDPQGNVISSRKAWEYFTVNLQAQTITYQGW